MSKSTVQYSIYLYPDSYDDSICMNVLLSNITNISVKENTVQVVIGEETTLIECDGAESAQEEFGRISTAREDYLGHIGQAPKPPATFNIGNHSLTLVGITDVYKIGATMLNLQRDGADQPQKIEEITEEIQEAFIRSWKDYQDSLNR